MFGIVPGTRDNNGRSKGNVSGSRFLLLLLLLLFFSGQIESLSIKFQAVGYEFDNDEFHAFVHGKLPYEKLKPDPVLRNLLLSMPQRKIVCQTLTCFGLTEKFL